MSKAQNTSSRQRRAKEKIKELFKRPDQVTVVHYSCENFNKPEGLSPRVVSIAVKNLETNQGQSFSIHLQAEKDGIAVDQIDSKYDELERKMLDEFYNYVDRHQANKWLHWNMNSMKYGFMAIAHRYEVHGGQAVNIDEDRLYCLNNIFQDKYGDKYIDDQKLEKLTAFNNISKHDALPGEEEAEAFRQKEFAKLHYSTMRKVDHISKLARKEWDGTLKTRATWRQMHATSLLAIIEWFTDTPFNKLMGVVASAYAIIQLLSVAASLITSLLAQP